MEVRRADIRIDLGAQSLADANRAKLMMNVARMTISPVETRADEFGLEALIFRDLKDLLSDNAFAGSFDLRHFDFPSTPLRSASGQLRCGASRPLRVSALGAW